MMEHVKDFARAVRSLFPSVRDWVGQNENMTIFSACAKDGRTNLMLVYARGADAEVLRRLLKQEGTFDLLRRETPDPIADQEVQTVLQKTIPATARQIEAHYTD